MCGLEIERLLDLGIGSYQEMDENKEWNKEGKREIWNCISMTLSRNV